MKLLNKLIIGALAAFSAAAAHADDIYEAKLVESLGTNQSGDSKSISLTLLGKAADGCQVWGGSNDDMAGCTSAYWHIDTNLLYCFTKYIYPYNDSSCEKNNLSGYKGTYETTITNNTGLYQFIKVKGETSAELFIASGNATKTAFDDICVTPEITLTPADVFTINDGNDVRQFVNYSITGITADAIVCLTLKWSYDEGKTWEADSLTSDNVTASGNFLAFHPNDKEQVRYKVSLHPKAEYRAVTKGVYDSDETEDFDISATSRVVYNASKVTMRTYQEQSTSAQPGDADPTRDYTLLGVTAKGNQIWSGTTLPNCYRFADWCVDDEPTTYTILSKNQTDFDANTIYSLSNDFHQNGSTNSWRRRVCSGDDYVHFIKVNSKMSADYFSSKYEEGSTFCPADFQIATSCSVKPTGDYSVNSTDGNLCHDVTYSIKNADAQMLDSAVVEISSDGGQTWTNGVVVKSFSGNENTATVAADHIPLLASKVRYRLTVYPKNLYKVVCQYWTPFETVDYPVTRPTDGLNDVVVYKRVMTEDQLVAGATYLIVNAASGNALGYQDTNTRTGYGVKMSGNKVKIAEDQIATSKTIAGDKRFVYELKLGGEPGAWTFYDKVGGKYLYAAGDNSGNNYYLKLQNKANTDQSKASVTLNSGDAVITFGGDVMGNTIGYYNGSFTCFPSIVTHSPVQLYRKTSTLSISSAGYATLFTDDAFTMPEGVTGYTVTQKADNTLSLNALYTEGAAVPALTPLLLKANEGSYNFLAVSSADEAPADNLLHGSLASETTSAEGTNLYYKLSLGTDGKAGFYWGAPEGAAFTNAAGKAYLVLPKTEASSPLRGFAFDPDDAVTGIASAVEAHAAAAPAIHDLNGRRLSTLQGAQKGVYIVNGKKALVK